MSMPTPRRRRWFQFSPAMMFVAVTVVSFRYNPIHATTSYWRVSHVATAIVLDNRSVHRALEVCFLTSRGSRGRMDKWRYAKPRAISFPNVGGAPLFCPSCHSIGPSFRGGPNLDDRAGGRKTRGGR
jgi:hypothetical protein